MIIITLCSCKKLPGNIPDEATLDTVTRNYFLQDKIEGNIRLRIWNQLGELQTEEITTSDDTITQQYYKGKIISKSRYSELKKQNDKKPELPKKPANVPSSAIFSHPIGGWAEKSNIKANGDIVWKLWYESGEKKGYCKFEKLDYNGKCRYYNPATGILFGEEIFKNGYFLTVTTIASSNDILKLPKENQSKAIILSETEPKLDEIWDSL